MSSPRSGLVSAVLFAAGLALGPGIAQAQTLSINDVTVTEGTNANATFTVTLNRQGSNRRVRVSYATQNGSGVAGQASATAGQDYTAVSGRLEFPTGTNTRTITVPITNDTAQEPTEFFRVVLSNPDRATIADGTGVGTIVDNDTPAATVTITGPAAAINEGGTLAYVISRTGATTAALTVNITVGGTANAQDYNAIPTTVTIPAGSASTTLNVVTINDTAAEAAETVIISLGNGTGYVVGVPGAATGNINASDQPPGNATVTITGPTAAVDEGALLAYTVTRNPVAATALTVNFTLGGTATSGTDYTNPGTTVQIPANAASATISVQTINDQTPEPAETVVITLATSTSYVIGTPGSATGNINPSDQTAPNQSINSTSQNSAAPVVTQLPVRPQVTNTTYSVLAINDLGMHCGDLDTRVASILPPFQVLLAQVVQKGATPVLNPAGVSVHYSAVQNANDPILSTTAFPGRMDNGNTYKTNFWDTVARGAYDPFYPAFNPFNPAQTLTPLAGPPFNVTADKGLPVPNVENLYLGTDLILNNGNESLTAVQHSMPGISSPYVANAPQLVEEHYRNKPFFVNFPFGYVAANVNWWEAAGPPFAAFDDYGRQNAYPLVRVEARTAASGANAVSTVDTVLPISGEASCANCHATDGPNTRTNQPATTLANAGLPVATQLSDPNPNMPPSVSIEYGSDINVLRLHDLKHGARYLTPTGTADACTINAATPNGTASCLTNKALVQNRPVVCQVCHYTPALDLAHLGPLSGAVGTVANGRNQLPHQSNSRVMHNHHGQFTALFPAIEPAVINQTTGAITNQATRLQQLENSCYQCHPGAAVKCLRGAMFNGAMLCNDCHGNMTQVGNDFTKNVTTTNPGPNAWVFNQGNFYDPNSTQPRVPWANEPGCGSCHTGDAASNQANIAGGVVNVRDSFNNVDGIRLRQAFRTGDAKATPIVPTNKRFAEPVVPANFNGVANKGAGNPQLYRVSTGHGGVMCEGCHGATHAEFPNGVANANDNVTSNQLQGHVGVIVECSTCHGTANLGNTLNGPHGMHPVGANTGFADGGHRNAINGNNCVVCHGPNATANGRSNNVGTVLSRAQANRNFAGLEGGGAVARGQPVGCTNCH